MRWNRLPRTLRRTAAAAGALVFLCGSNYCVLAALGGAEMACLASPAAQTHGSHCAHAAPKAPTAPHATSPCCVTAAPVSTPQVERGDVVTPLWMHLHDTGPAFLVLAPSLRVPRDSDESPPARPDPPARHLGRAPPLA